MAITPLDRLLEYNMHLLKDSGHPRLFAAWWHDLITAAASAWFFGGLVAAVQAGESGTSDASFTWWHLVFYTGYLATAAWIAYLAVRSHRADGRTGLAAVPHGYGPAVVGVPLFLVSALADLIWHGVFGAPGSLDLLFSPPHLGLAVSGVLIVASPWLSAWRRDALGAEPEAVGAHLRFAAPALSLGYVFSAVVLLVSYGIAFAWSPREVASGLGEADGAAGWAVAASVMFTTLAVLALVVVASGRFVLPVGFFTVAFVFPALMAGANAGFENGAFAVLFLVSGALADLLTWLVRPDLRRRKDLITFAVIWSLLTWLAYMIIVLAAEDVWPAVEITTGAPIAAALIGAAFMLVIQPDHREAAPPRPAEPSPFDEVIARAKAMTAHRGDQV
ncbi:hypothetical protein [Glycomyces arizonensis]|uniref:hypothetical protein n=1 Tax=Glycomyces arizonensis TaxID=256035 RepID=UPI0012EB9B38|nr:hypothetical protein [Glycomyces arizonensis]